MLTITMTMTMVVDDDDGYDYGDNDDYDDGDDENTLCKLLFITSILLRSTGVLKFSSSDDTKVGNNSCKRPFITPNLTP